MQLSLIFSVSALPGCTVGGLAQRPRLPHCRSAFSLLDPQAVERALQGYKTAANGPAGITLPTLADALVMLERDRLRALADRKKDRGSLFNTDVTGNLDLGAIGIAMVAKMLD